MAHVDHGGRRRTDRDREPLAYERRVWFESPGISAFDFRCRIHRLQDGPEEPNRAHSIAIVRRGLFRRTDRGTTLTADPSRVLFFNAGRPYRYSHPVAGGDDCTILTVATPLALELVARYAPRDAERPETPFAIDLGLTSPRAIRLHYEFLALLRQHAPTLLIDDALVALADEVLRASYAMQGRHAHEASRPTAAFRRRRELAEAAALAINEQIDRPPDLSTLARTLGCSPCHLSRSFHQVAGVSLRRYVGRLRALTAAHALAAGSPDLTTLALDLGFTDHSHFANAFRREWGQPPSHFRDRTRTCKRHLPAPGYNQGWRCDRDRSSS
jgi:AraC-like DNA-binding protein